MKTKTTGLVLIIVGIMLVAYTGFNYITTEKVMDLGPVQINQEKNHPVQWSPLIGALLLVSGIVITISDKKMSI